MTQQILPDFVRRSARVARKAAVGLLASSGLLIDIFAGFGGGSIASERAHGRPVNIAINHWPKAIEFHERNHPLPTIHFTSDVREIDPLDATEGMPVLHAHFSPDCFPAGTLVLTMEGYRPIETLKVGDAVLTHKLRWRKVVETHKSHRPILKIRGHGHPGLRVSPEHPILARKGESKWNNPERKYDHKLLPQGWITAANVDKGWYWGTPRQFPETPVPPIPGRQLDIDERLMWLAGRYLGDGWTRFTKTRAELVIICGKHEADELKKTLAVWPRKAARCQGGELHWNHRTLRTAVQFTANHRGLVEWLRTHFGHRAEAKRIPGWALGMPENLRHALMAGYLSADGHRCATWWEFHTVSRPLAFGLKALANSLNKTVAVYDAPPTSNVIEGRTVKTRPMYKVRWRDEIAHDHEQTVIENGIEWTPVRESTDTGETLDVFNIGVDGDESFVAEGIIVHNCRHFSSAKGGQPVSDGVRALPWVIVDWAKAVRPTLITMENVKEFLTWGPTESAKVNGKRQYFPNGDEKRIPIKARAGQTFRRWVEKFKALGYKIGWKKLNAKSWGAPTDRARLFIVMRCDGKDVAWPEPTHGPEGSGLIPYRTAAECIDFSRPCPSIFMTKAQAAAYGKATGIRCNRPLADKTLWRIANGLARYVIESKKPFIISTAYTGTTGRGTYVYPPEEPLRTITSSNDKAVIAPAIAKYYSSGDGKDGQATYEPLDTITTKARFGLIAANMVKANHGGPDVRATPIDQPLGAVTTKHGNGVVASHLMKFRGDSVGTPADAPVPTITAGQGAARDAGAAHALGVSSAVLVECANASGTNGARDVQRPAATVTANPKGGAWAVAESPMVPFVAGCGGRAGQSAPTAGDAPIGTITAKNDRVLAAAHLTVYHGEKDAEARNSDLSNPLPTQDTSNRFGLSMAFLSKLRGSGGWKPADAPLDVVCAGAPTFGVVAACLTKFYGTAIGADLLKPLATVTADAGGGHLGAIHAYLSQGVDESALAGFWRVYAFLIEQLGKEAPLPLVEVDGHLYLIVDVGMRMLEPRELLNAQFTPELAKDYVLPTNKSLAVKLIGNSVSPPVLEALIRAQGIGGRQRKRRAA